LSADSFTVVCVAVRGSRTVAISFSIDTTNLPEEGRTFSSALRRDSGAAISRGR
jgi:hypothetical protein